MKLTEILKLKKKVEGIPIRCDYTDKIIGYVIDVDDIRPHIYSVEVYKDFFGERKTKHG